MAVLNFILGGFAALSFALVMWQWLAARKFPLHRKIAVPGFAPPVSILKPLKGCDETTAASLASWLAQDYAGPVEIIFGVADAADPVCGVVQRLIAENPAVRCRLVICENLAGANAKVAKLAQLEKLAVHDLILTSDADVRVPPHFLGSFAAPLREEKCGLVNCFYRLANPVTAAMRWEAVAVNADFWSQVLQSQTLKPLDFALGAAILIRRKVLAQIGGFGPLANCLADDYHLGKRISQRGHHIAICPIVVECWDAPQTWRQVWKHQIRWARTIRVCQPGPYFLSILSNPTLWPTVWVVATPNQFSAGFFVASLFARLLITENLLHRFAQRPVGTAPVFGPLKDVLQVGVWLAAFLGNAVEWRGRKMRVRRNGMLEDT